VNDHSGLNQFRVERLFLGIAARRNQVDLHTHRPPELDLVMQFGGGTTVFARKSMSKDSFHEVKIG